MNVFNVALAIADMEYQEKQKVKNAKKTYIADLVAMGIDKEMAKTMAKTFFESGLVKAL